MVAMKLENNLNLFLNTFSIQYTLVATKSPQSLAIPLTSLFAKNARHAIYFAL